MGVRVTAKKIASQYEWGGQYNGQLNTQCVLLRSTLGIYLSSYNNWTVGAQLNEQYTL